MTWAEWTTRLITPNLIVRVIALCAGSVGVYLAMNRAIRKRNDERKGKEEPVRPFSFFDAAFMAVTACSARAQHMSTPRSVRIIVFVTLAVVAVI